MAGTLHLLSAGAAKGVVEGLRNEFVAATGAAIDARFSAAATITRALVAGDRCDLVILPSAPLADLTRRGLALAQPQITLGIVHTGIAIAEGGRRPDVSTAAALRQALAACPAVFVPSLTESTAGAHFAGMIKALRIDGELTTRVRAYPNGATAMNELARCRVTGALGCTQVSEINYTPGVTLVDRLPAEFDLATPYAGAVSASTRDHALAERFVHLLASPNAKRLRVDGGFLTSFVASGA